VLCNCKTAPNCTAENPSSVCFYSVGPVDGFHSAGHPHCVIRDAGAIWLYQAFSRKHPLHYWIGLTLLALGGASVGLLPQYPGPWLPLLGVILALAFAVGDPISRKLKQEDLAEACRGMEAVRTRRYHDRRRP